MRTESKYYVILCFNSLLITTRNPCTLHVAIPLSPAALVFSLLTLCKTNEIVNYGTQIKHCSDVK